MRKTSKNLYLPLGMVEELEETGNASKEVEKALREYWGGEWQEGG